MSNKLQEQLKNAGVKIALQLNPEDICEAPTDSNRAPRTNLVREARNSKIKKKTTKKFRTIIL